MQRPLLLLTCLALLPACAAERPDPEPVANASQPIVGGVLDHFRSYVVGVGDSQGVFCTGTLISRRVVLTAGHCYSKNQGPQGGITRIFFGAKTALNANPPPVQVATVKGVRHPSFSFQSLKNDLTLVQLAADAPTQPAPILRETMANTPEWIGPNFTYVGYGDDNLGGFDVRRTVSFPIVAVGPAQVGLDTGTGPIDDTMFYYRVMGKNTCSGDSGGPSFVVRSGVERVAGTTSFGDADCLIDGVNARADGPIVSSWIQPTIDALENDDPCRADGNCDESCNVGNQLVDPDCAQDHCGADGMCVISCVNPVDPDCLGASHCGPDGACDPSCSPADVDCVGSSSSSSSSSSGSSSSSSSSSSGGGASSSSSSSSTSASSSSSSGTTSTSSSGSVGGGGQGGSAPGGAGGQGGGDQGGGGSGGQAGGESDADSGCGCTTPGSSGGDGGRAAFVLAAGLAIAIRRRRR
jgi:MYXO-CTERM domain-containing protein